MTGALVDLVPFLLLGTLFGLVHFSGLRRVTHLLLSGGSLKRGLALLLGRILLLVAVLYWLAQQGAGPLLAGALGMILAREVVLRRTRKEV